MSISSVGTIAVLQIEPEYHEHMMKKTQKKDGQRIMSAMKVVAEGSGMKPVITRLCGRNATVERVNKWIKAQKKNPPSVALLHCNGHGIQDTFTHSKWPAFLLSKKQVVASSKMMDEFEKIPARLTVSHIDACNSKRVSEGRSYKKKMKRTDHFAQELYEDVKKLQKKVCDKKDIEQGAKALFKNTKGHVRIAAASPGEISVAYPRLGGVSTMMLQKALLHSSRKGERASWVKIGEKLNKVKKARLIQTPLVSIKVEKVANSVHTVKHVHEHESKHKHEFKHVYERKRTTK